MSPLPVISAHKIPQYVRPSEGRKTKSRIYGPFVLSSLNMYAPQRGVKRLPKFTLSEQVYQASLRALLPLRSQDCALYLLYRHNSYLHLDASAP